MPSILHELRTFKEPPTYHRTNKFTRGFQAIVDAYGVAQYREVNPGLFTVITFPFFFAVMFGDVGHGVMITLFALWAVRNERRIAQQDHGEIFGSFFNGRYLILLMGLFSIYTGFMYNDVFSRAFYMSTGGWTWRIPTTVGETIDAQKSGSIYPFGIDPAWHLAENSLIFVNSYKMKMAIIFGVVHMSFGICLQVFNHLHFKHFKYIWAEFLPQIIFMNAIFGYLVVCIIAKWCMSWDTAVPPSLLNMLIDMFLAPGTVKERLYAGQEAVQLALLLIAAACVPWMLLTKPFLLKREHSRILEAGYSGLVTSEATTNTTRVSAEGDEAGGAVVQVEMTKEETFEFSDIMVHQIIHTIEFCLGCISNTASYLRLWALSLAHAQLSDVLWHMVLGNVLDSNVVMLFVGFGFWLSLTIFILLLMEGLSAFLHALRLHWVEFNNKFYNGNGYMFVPFSFRSVLHPDEDE